MEQITQANIGTFQSGSRAVIRTKTVYDANGRVVALIDDRGAQTTYTYDLLDRQITMTFQDGSTRTSVYNLASDLVTYTDENGSVLSNTYDCLGRKTAVAITEASDVISSYSQAFQYDGLSRLTWCQDKPLSFISVDAAFSFDSLGRVIEEAQTYESDTRYVTHDAWTSLTATDLTYPSGRQVTSGYDALYRRNAINETSGGASIAAWHFFGNRTALVALGNGITCSFMNNAGTRSAVQFGQPTPPWGDMTTDQLGYDGSGRLISKRFLPSSSTTALVGFTTYYDPASNKLFERALHAESRSALYPNYDSINRLLEYDRGILASSGGSITTAITLPGTDSQRTYNLDDLGNWKNTAYTPVGGSPTTEIRRHNLVNQITKFATTPVLYDHGNNAASSNPLVAAQGNGNIADDGTRVYGNDALNRLTTVSSTASGTPQVAAYTYDALGRRVLKVTSNGGIAGTIVNATYRYLYDGNQIVEELLVGETTTTLRQFVWGQYIDELIQLNIPTTTTTPPLTAGTYYPLQDLLYRTMATTNGSGSIVEAYDYDAYGNTLMYNGPGTDGLWFTDDDVTTLQPMCEFLFTGRQYDPETEIYWYRARYYQPGLGRFLSKDMSGPNYVTNLYQSFDSAPVRMVDPLGLQATECDPKPDPCAKEALALQQAKAAQAAATAADTRAQATQAAALATLNSAISTFNIASAAQTAAAGWLTLNLSLPARWLTGLPAATAGAIIADVNYLNAMNNVSAATAALNAATAAVSPTFIAVRKADAAVNAAEAALYDCKRNHNIPTP